jgi:hypothetical protein
MTNKKTDNSKGKDEIRGSFTAFRMTTKNEQQQTKNRQRQRKNKQQQTENSSGKSSSERTSACGFSNG